MISKQKRMDFSGDISLTGPRVGVNFHSSNNLKTQPEKIKALREFLKRNDSLGSGIESKLYHESVLNASKIILPEKLVKEPTLDEYKKLVLWVEETPKNTTILLENCQKDTNYYSMSMYSALALVSSQMDLELNIEGVSDNFGYTDEITPDANEILNMSLSNFFKEKGATVLSPRWITSLYRRRICGHTRLKNGIYTRGENNYCFATVNYPIYIAEAEKPQCKEQEIDEDTFNT